MLWLVTQILWFGLAALIILIDRRLMNRAFDPNTTDVEIVDLKDRSATPFLGLMLIFGGLVLPFYFWYSRRSAAAVLVGIVLMFALGIVVARARIALLS